MPPTVQRWVSIRRRATLSYRMELAVAVLSLGLSSFAISRRDHWHQLQAYTVLSLFSVAFVLFSTRSAREKHRSIDVKTDTYCVDCKDESRATISVGLDSVGETSLYERLFARPVDAWVIVAVWAVWICYGALFHDGQHVFDENKLLDGIVSSSFAHSLPPFLRGLRHVILYGFAVASLFSKSVDTAHSVVFVLLSFFPSTLSTPQELALGALFVRAVVFFMLFLLSESIERVRPYAWYVMLYDDKKSVLLAAVQMARREAHRSSVSTRCSPFLAMPNAHTVQGGGSNPAETLLHERRRDIDKILSRVRSPLRSAWVLVVSPNAYASAMSLLVLMLAITWFNWRCVGNAMRSKSNLLRVLLQQKRSTRKRPVLPVTAADAGVSNRPSSPSPQHSQPARRRTPAGHSLPRQRRHASPSPVPTKTPSPPVATKLRHADSVPPRRRAKRPQRHAKEHRSPDTSEDSSASTGPASNLADRLNVHSRSLLAFNVNAGSMGSMLAQARAAVAAEQKKKNGKLQS